MRTLTSIGLLIVTMAVCTSAYAQGFWDNTFSREPRETSLLFGYGENHRIPETTLNRFQFGSLKLRYANTTSPRNQTGYEFSLMQDKGDVSIATAAATINYRHYFSVRGNTALSWDLGIGGMYMNDEFPGQATLANFIEVGGITFQYGISKDKAFTIEYRYNHASNAGLELPNRGINMSNFNIGYSWYK